MNRAALPSRLARVREAMRAADVDALLLSLGADLPWLSGYVAMPLERLTMLVVPAYGERAVLVVPTLEAPRVVPVPDVFEVKPWGETEDPVEIVSGLVGKLAPSAPVLGISDRAWSSALLKLQASLPQADWVAASGVTAPLRAVKDAWELEALARASAAADRVAAALIAGEVKLIGRTEQDVSAELARRLHAEGHERVEFAIVGSGPNSASPHHEPGARKIGPGEAVVCDFGGSVDGYCSDITRTVFTGPPPRRLERIYTVVAEAQAAGVRAVRPGVPCSDVDAAARDVITDAGFGEHFIHRTGHGIGIEGHEDPYIVSNNSLPLSPGHVFSVEPGVYVPGHYGVRIEDIVAATEDGPSVLNQASRALTVVDV